MVFSIASVYGASVSVCPNGRVLATVEKVSCVCFFYGWRELENGMDEEVHGGVFCDFDMNRERNKALERERESNLPLCLGFLLFWMNQTRERKEEQLVGFFRGVVVRKKMRDGGRGSLFLGSFFFFFG